VSWITDYTTALEACLADKFGSLCAWGVVAGSAPSLDYCGGCEGDGCGQWWIAVQSIFPFTTFPNPDDTAQCGTELGVNIQVGVARCFPVPEDGDPVTHEQHAEAFAEQMADALAMHAAIACCVTGYTVALGTYDPIGPEGGCLGGTWTLNVAKK
jgi:hypothetical protein